MYAFLKYKYIDYVAEQAKSNYNQQCFRRQFQKNSGDYLH